MDRTRFWELLAKKDAGEASPEEQLELHQLLDSGIADSEALKRAVSDWENISLFPADISAEETGKAWGSLREAIGSRVAATTLSPVDGDPAPIPAQGGFLHNLRFYRLIGSAAAVALLALGSWWLIPRYTKPVLQKDNIVSTKKGSTSKIVLPDGTQVWLNASSTVTYNDSYGKGLREVRLSGEAFFDVKKDAGSPLVIHTKVLTITVLGTAFNVRAYPEDQTTETALIRGSVEVSIKGRESGKWLLKPNEKLTVVNSDPESAVRTTAPRKEAPDQSVITLSHLRFEPADSSLTETSWISNRLIFRSRPFGDLARELERRFDATIVFADSAIRNKTFSGTITEESLTEILDYMKLSDPFHYVYDREKRKVTISR